MEADAVSSRPESPKKKVKANPDGDSEAQPSDYSQSTSNVDSKTQPDHSLAEVNGLAPTRKYIKSSTPDSSSERAQTSNPTRSMARVIQEEEISSSEVSSSVSRIKKGSYGAPTAGGADSICEPEDLTTVCDSASSDLNDRH